MESVSLLTALLLLLGLFFACSGPVKVGLLRHWDRGRPVASRFYYQDAQGDQTADELSVEQ